MNKRNIIMVLLAIVIIGVAIFAMTNMNSSTTSSINIDASALEDGGSLIVDGKNLEKNKFNFHTESEDANAILVKNGGALKLADSLINKSGDSKTEGDDADFYGVNSAVLVNTNGSLDVSNCEIVTNSKGSNAIFVTNAEDSANGDSSQNTGGQPPEASGDNPQEKAGGQPPEKPQSQDNNGQAPDNNGTQPPEKPQSQDNNGQAPDNNGTQPPEKPQSQDNNGQAPNGNGGQPGETGISGTTEAKINNVKITTYSDKSRGLDATYNGKISAENVIINTNGQSCAGLATDRGEGEVHVKNSEINTGVSKSNGRGSPLIYSTGNITLENSKGTSFVSQIACIEGKNSIELSNCDLTGYGGGNRQDGNKYVDLGGIFIYQSMSGDANIGTSHFIAENSKLTIPEESPVYKEAPMFHVTNTACVIDLKNTELNFGSTTFLEASSQNQWGNTGSNGGIVELNTDSEKIDGNITVDSISSLTWNMKNTEFKGAINSTGNTTVNVTSGSTWTLTGDSSVSALEVSGDINYGDYSLSVGNKTYNSSNPFKG